MKFVTDKFRKVDQSRESNVYYTSREISPKNSHDYNASDILMTCIVGAEIQFHLQWICSRRINPRRRIYVNRRTAANETSTDKSRVKEKSRMRRHSLGEAIARRDATRDEFQRDKNDELRKRWKKKCSMGKKFYRRSSRKLKWELKFEPHAKKWLVVTAKI